MRISPQIIDHCSANTVLELGRCRYFRSLSVFENTAASVRYRYYRPTITLYHLSACEVVDKIAAKTFTIFLHLHRSSSGGSDDELESGEHRADYCQNQECRDL